MAERLNIIFPEDDQERQSARKIGVEVTRLEATAQSRAEDSKRVEVISSQINQTNTPVNPSTAASGEPESKKSILNRRSTIAAKMGGAF